MLVFLEFEPEKLEKPTSFQNCNLISYHYHYDPKYILKRLTWWLLHSANLSFKFDAVFRDTLQEMLEISPNRWTFQNSSISRIGFNRWFTDSVALLKTKGLIHTAINNVVCQGPRGWNYPRCLTSQKIKEINKFGAAFIELYEYNLATDR